MKILGYVPLVLLLSNLAMPTAFAEITKTIESKQITKPKAEVEIEPEPEIQVWDLTDLYPTHGAWDTSFEEVKVRIAELIELKGSLDRNASKMADGLEQMSSVAKELYRLYVYASLINDEDQRVGESQARLAKVALLASEYGETISWVGPEVLEIAEWRIERFIKREPRLEAFDFYLRDIVRQAPHTLDEKGEALVASASSLLSSPNNIYELLVNANVPWPTVTLSNGEEVYLNQAGYSGSRGSSNRDDRRLVFDTFWAQWGRFQDSIGAILGTEVQANIFQAKARNYDSVLQMQLSEENLPEAVYRTLVQEVNASLPTLHRYFRLRAKILGIEEMEYYDIYPPLVESSTVYDVETSKRISLEVLEQLGPEYYDHLVRAVNANWAHVYPQPGKRSGAYMNGSAYDVHPYVLLNHQNDYTSLSTYAHEWGHAVHSMLANEAQPFQKADYSTFTAEIASIINEFLIEEYLIANAETREEKLFFLGEALESMRGTFYRQTMFAEFELAMHERAEAGDPLTGEVLSQIYGDLLRKYHGHDEGVVNINDAYTMEWAYIPHFYYDFYVFQYSTSIAGAAWFAEQLLAGDTEIRDTFIDVLKAGGSNHAYQILLDAGLDMAKPDPYRATVRRMEDIMDRIEAILDEPEES